MFRVPSSEPPSTPDRRSLRSIPSTTPAGPPPSSNRALPSFTPRGAPPPSSAFGSSQFGTGNARPLFSNNRNGASTTSMSRGRQMPPSSPPEPILIDDMDADGSDDGMALAPPPGLEDDSMMIDDSIQQISPGFGFMKSLGGSSRYDSSRGNKRLRGGEVLRPVQHVPRRIEGLDIQGYAKGVAASANAPQLSDPDDVVLDTELQTEPLVAAIRGRFGTEEVAELASDLLKTWRKHGALKKEEVENEDIGPLDPQAKLSKANMLASLLLLTHAPNSADGAITPVPSALLEWLDHNHDPSANVLDEVLSQKKRGYYASAGFWDAIYLGLNRGRFSTVIQLFEGARFEDHSELEFSPQQKEGMHEAVGGAIRILQQCPAVANNNWDIKGADWTLWRHQVERASEDLRAYAEESESGGGSLFGSRMGNSEMAMSQRSRKVDSNIPFEIYEPLQDMYTQLKGSPADILKSSYDWLEAAITLTIWWDGSEEKGAKSSLAASRQSLARKNQTREVDLNPLQAYRNQLASSLILAVREEDVREGLDTTSDLHLALACVLLDDVEQAIELCKAWSMPIACSLAELATAGQWMASSGSRADIANFDKSDLMVLSYGQPEQQGSVKDKLLEQYARLLAPKNFTSSTDPDRSMEGWEMALRVLGRLDDVEKANARVTELLEKISITSNERVDNVLMLCIDLGFGQHGMTIAERYADQLADTTSRYGDALTYYLRAHKFAKAKKVIDVLITSSLVQSTAYPTSNNLDARLRELIEQPKESLNNLAATDLEAAQKLGAWLSGYATLRRFYNLRDEVEEDEDLRDAARRKREAATALLAVITSANDPIRGGLFDPNAEIVVPVDTLLVLLGEALPLLRESSSPSPFKQPQLFTLLRAVEDLQTIGPRIYAQAETLFQTTLENAYGADVPSPRAMLRKEVSGMTGSSQFSLVGSSMLNSKGSVDTHMEGSGESGVIVDGDVGVRRGWDWRKGLSRSGKGEDVLKILRLALAERVADAWCE